MRFIASLVSILFLLSGVAPTAHAQALPGIEELGIALSPQYPRPYESVTATVNSTLIDLAAATIAFTVNGKPVGEGDRSITFTAPAAGVKTVVSVSAKDMAGTHSASATFYPADVALVVESGSTVPPFYKGARLVASAGTIRIVALANLVAGGTKVAPQNLVYTWKFGDKLLEANSGIGKSVLTAQAPVRYRDARITLTVSTQDKSVSAQASTLISPVDPVMRLYENDPLRGIDFSHALSGTFSLASDEETFRAVPFFYAAFPKIAWTLNGTQSDTDPDLTVRTTGSSQGTAVVGVRGSDPTVTNNAEANLRVQFGQARSTGIFGL